MALACAIGFFLAAGLMVLRRLVPAYVDVCQFAQRVAIALATVGTVALVLGSGKGGDAGMAAITFLIFGGLTLLVGGLIVLLVAKVQSLAFGTRTRREVAPIVVEILALGAILWVFQESFIQPKQRAITNAWSVKDQARRTARENVDRQIPPQFKAMTPQFLDQQESMERWVSQHGPPVRPAVPPKVADAIRARANLEGEVMPDRERQQELLDLSKQFNMTLPAAWFCSALVLPWAFRRLHPSKPPRMRPPA